MHRHTHLYCALPDLGDGRPLMLCDCSPRGFRSAPMDELCWLPVEKPGNPYILRLRSSSAHPFILPPSLSHVSSMNSRLSLGRRSPCDRDKTASADTACISEKPNEPIWGRVTVTNYSTAKKEKQCNKFVMVIKINLKETAYLQYYIPLQGFITELMITGLIYSWALF